MKIDKKLIKELVEHLGEFNLTELEIFKITPNICSNICTKHPPKTIPKDSQNTPQTSPKHPPNISQTHFPIRK